MTFTFDTPMPILLDNIANLESMLKFILNLTCNSYSCLENLLLIHSMLMLLTYSLGCDNRLKCLKCALSYALFT